MARAGSLIVDLTANTASFRQQMGAAQKTLGGFRASTLQILDPLEKAKRPLTELAREALGVRGPIARLGEKLLEFGVGGGIVGLVAAGVALVGYAFESMREKAKKAKEEADATFTKLQTGFQQRYDSQRPGAAATRVQQQAATAIKELDTKIAAARATLAGPGLTPIGVDQLNTRIKGWQDEIAKFSQGATEAGRRYIDATRTMTKGSDDLMSALRLEAATLGQGAHAAERYKLAQDMALAHNPNAAAILAEFDALHKKIDAQTAATAAATQQADAVKSLIGQLEQEAATTGQSAAQVQAYRLAHLGASASVVAHAKALAAEIDAQQRFKDRVKAAADEMEAINKPYADAIDSATTMQHQLEAAIATWGQSSEAAQLYQLALMGVSKEQIAVLQGLIRQRDALKAASDQTKHTARDTIDAFEATRSVIRGSADDLTTLFDDLPTKGLSAFADFASGLLRTWTHMINQILAQKLAAAIFGDGSGLQAFFGKLIGGAASAAGGSGGLAGTFDIPIEGYHTGGIVGQDGTPRTVSAAAFYRAPRMHAGGIAGDEVPAILQKGERVIPRGQSLRGGDTVVHFTYAPSIQAWDTTTAVDMLEQHGPVIADQVLRAVRSSRGYRQALYHGGN